MLATFSSCTGNEPRPLTTDDYEVYVAALRDHFVTQGIRPDPPCYVVVGTTASQPVEMAMTPKRLKNLVQGLRRYPGMAEAAQDFYRESQWDVDLEARLPLDTAYVFIDMAVADSARSSSAGGASFTSRYSPNPSGFFTLSRVGFSPDRLRAYVYVAHHAYMDGWGRDCFLEKRGRSWRVLFWGGMWIT